jgi:SAM-dependent methyltransferase
MNMSVGEIHLKGLQYATQYGIKNRYQFDLLNTPFSNEFDAVCIFDVLEHIQDDDLALKNIHKSLNKNGKIAITVPAHMWLWNRDDAIVGHKRRYTKKQLITKLENNGFEILSARYFFMSIVPLLFIRTIVKKDNKSKILKSEYNNDRSMNFILSTSLLLVSKLENIFNFLLPNLFGGSLLLIAKRL